MAYNIPTIFSVPALSAALNTAMDHATSLSQGGWVRLAAVEGSAKDPYIIAARRLKDGRVQFSCGCPHWRFRCQTQGVICKHQQAFLCGGLLGGKPAKIEWQTAGVFFLQTLAKVTAERRVTRHVAPAALQQAA